MTQFRAVSPLFLFFSASLASPSFCMLVGSTGVFKEVLSRSATQCAVLKRVHEVF